MMALDVYKQCGILSVALISLAATFMLVRWRSDTAMSLSEHAAAEP